MAKKKEIIPKHELEALAEVLFPTMKDYLSSPEGKEAFKNWQKEQSENLNSGKAATNG